MYAMFEILLNMSLTASVLAIIVILFRIVLKKLPRKYVCILWAFVALRLVWPFCISSSLSAYNLLDTGMDMTGQVNYFHYNEKKETHCHAISRRSGDTSRCAYKSHGKAGCSFWR